MLSIQVFQQRCPISIRKVHIRHQQIDRLLRQDRARIGERGSKNRLAIHRLGHQVAEDVEHSRLVIDHQHARAEFAQSFAAHRWHFVSHSD
jgi:hypothetical protein